MEPNTAIFEHIYYEEEPCEGFELVESKFESDGEDHTAYILIKESNTENYWLGSTWHSSHDGTDFSYLEISRVFPVQVLKTVYQDEKGVEVY